MDTTLWKMVPFTGILYLALLSSINGLQTMGERDVSSCVFFSESFGKSMCLDQSVCNTRCVEQERAKSGYCDNYACKCEYDCANLCADYSSTWSGPCFQETHCSGQCEQKEGYFRGTCVRLQCWCFKWCS